MATGNFKSMRLLLMTVLCTASLNLGNAVKWNDETCSGENMMVTFNKCCGNEPYCSANKKQLDCEGGEIGLYCQWIEPDDNGNNTYGRCVPQLDERSDVCCRGGAVKDACHSIAYKMECPRDWLVKKGCCPDSTERKYNKVLSGIPKDMDCCNSPCTQVEKAISAGNTNCTLSARCAPGPRSYAMTYNPYNTLGFFHDYRHHGVPHHFGSVIHGSGYDYDEDEDEDDEYDDHHEYGHHGYDGLHDHSKDRHVDEITVDDLMELLIESLEDDTDVKHYNAELYSDPYLGKQKSGGLYASLNLPHPDFYLDQLYGSPWGIPPGWLEHEFSNPQLIYSAPYGHNHASYYHGGGFDGLYHGLGHHPLAQFDPLYAEKDVTFLPHPYSVDPFGYAAPPVHMPYNQPPQTQQYGNPVYPVNTSPPPPETYVSTNQPYPVVAEPPTQPLPQYQPQQKVNVPQSYPAAAGYPPIQHTVPNPYQIAGQQNSVPQASYAAPPAPPRY